jgi:hypothetical protein
MPTRFKIRSYLTIVVDFAIEDDCYASILVENRLFTGEEVYDCEPSHSECCATRYIQTF